MSKELCFNIEGDALYLEQVLVEYMSVPIFFLCKGQKQYYIALCIDMEELNYVVSSISQTTVYNLLHGVQPMQDAILSQDSFWEVFSGDTIAEDLVQKKTIQELDISILPEKGACFEILTEELRTYVNRFDNEFLNNGYTEQECCSVCSEDLVLEGETSLSMVSETNEMTIETYIPLGETFSVPRSFLENLDYLDETMETSSLTKKIEVTGKNQQGDWRINPDDTAMSTVA